MAELVYSSDFKNRDGQYKCTYREWNGSEFVYYTVFSSQPCGATGEVQSIASINNSSNVRGEIKRSSLTNNLIKNG